MCFEDLVMCYIVFTNPMPNEWAEICFELLKISIDMDHITRDDLIHYCKRIAQLDENFVNLYYKRTKLDPRI